MRVSSPAGISQSWVGGGAERWWAVKRKMFRTFSSALCAAPRVEPRAEAWPHSQQCPAVLLCEKTPAVRQVCLSPLDL